RTSGADNNPNLTLRGIGGNALNGTSGAAPTTGVYIDDQPLQKRNANGLVTGSGSPLPLLYDLDRIEVLRGPQGTLYGGSSEGGTLRFITPTPSLTTYSGLARVGVSGVEGGGLGNEEGIAIGGPIVQDKLGFRISGYRDDRPGWIDDKSLYDGHTFGTDINKGHDYSLNFKLLWQITPDLKATLGFFGQENYDQDSSNFRLNSGAQVFAGGVFNNTGKINGVNFSFPATTFPAYTIPAMTQYGETSNSNGRYLSTTNVQYVSSPRRTIAGIPSLTLDYNWHDTLAFRSISTWDSNRTSGNTFTGGGSVRTGILPYSVTSNIAPEYIKGVPDVFNTYFFNNRHNAYSEEVRVSTIDPSSPLQFVAGIFFQKSSLRETVGQPGNENLVSLALRGVPEGYFLGGMPVNTMQVPGQPLIDVSTRNIAVNETELSGFADATYAITSKLKVTAGFRYTDYTQSFSQIYGGAVAGAPPGFVGASDTGAVETNPASITPFPTNYAACPTNNSTLGCPYQYTNNTLHEHPITPKVGLSYNLTSADLLYFTYAQGFRPGGVNPPVPVAQCAADLAALGIGATPATYKHDTVDSYEAGGKFRLFDGRAQLNTSVFRINWQDIQFTLPLRQCGFSYVANGAAATSTGFETQATGRVGPFLLNGNVAYDQAIYTADVLAVPSQGAKSAIIAKKGDNLGSPDWTVNLGAEYDHDVLNYPSYLRLDYMYTGKYERTTSQGTTSYNAAFFNGNETHTMNLRTGVYVKATEVAFYIKNLTNSQEILNLNEGVNSNVMTGSTFQPRTYGMQINYRW
ncbi:MAG: TonB-dependent receptor, plug, partial [Caulobacteraceae bacterium]|nr:TonB-dependent receptor, plug [Caulobacteraceae bacterium]